MASKRPAKRTGGLGRGLAALIPQGDPVDNDAAPTAANKAASGAKAAAQPKGARGAQSSKAASSERKVDMTNVVPGGKSKPRLSSGAASVLLGDGPQNTASSGRAAEAAAKAGTNVDSFGAVYEELPIGAIAPNSKQPRQVFDEAALEELIHSIREFGLMQPIVVRRAPHGTYELIMGERRLRAATKAGLKRIPAIVRETDDADMLRDALLENIHRVQLNPLEEAHAYQQLLEEFGVTQTELADKIGRSRPLITNMLRLLQLPVGAQRKVASGVISAGHARALLGLKAGAQAQEALADRIVAEGLSVRATEEAVVLINRGDEPAKKAKREKAPTPEFFTRAAESLADGLDTRVSVSVGKRKGRIVVEFGDKDDFERIIGLLRGTDER